MQMEEALRILYMMRVEENIATYEQAAVSAALAFIKEANPVLYAHALDDLESL